MTKFRIRILCVDDHPLVREGITRKIELQSDMQLVGAAVTGEEAVELFDRHRPDVTLMDLRLPSMSGLDAIRAIRSKDKAAKIVVLTMYHGDEDIHRALQAGATTYVLKNTASDDLMRVVREVHAGMPAIPAATAAQLARHELLARLTRREVTVVELLAKGMRNKEIAATLGISEDTVEVHLKNVFEKLQVNDRTAALMVALRRGIVHVD
jgi:DNA-binding NarL/FixJ family response regulator